MFLGKELMYGKTGILRTRQMNAIAQQQLAELGLHVRGAMLAEELSVGQQQIIEIAKALMTNASVIIMDEPTAALTDREIETLFTVINKLRKKVFHSCTFRIVWKRFSQYVMLLRFCVMENTWERD